MTKPKSYPPDSQPTHYKVPDLARLVGMTRWSLARYLEGRGIEYHYSGADRIVWLSELKDKAPALLRSVVFAEHMNRIAEAERDVEH